MTVWDTILTDFVELMEVDLYGTLFNSMHHTTSGLDTTLLPDATMNGAYSLEFGGVTDAQRDISNTLIFSTDVRLRVSFIVNQEAKADPDALTTDPVNDKHDYANAVRDIYAIIKKRLDVSTYAGVLDFVNFRGCSQLIFPGGTEEYCYCDITFNVGKYDTI